MSGFGIYAEGDSLGHKLDPRVKITFVILYTLAAFLVDGWMGILALVVVAALSLAACKITPLQALKMVRPFMFLMVFVALFDVLFVSSGTVWWQAGVVSLSSGGLLFAAKSVISFLCMVLGTSSLMRVTSPLQLSDGATGLLKPFERLGFNMGRLSLALGLAFRFIPAIATEFYEIRQAQLARYASFDGGVVKRLKSYTSVIAPLFSNSLSRSEVLALAIENRGYDPDETRRTCYRQYSLGFEDGFTLMVALVLVIASVIL